MFQLEKANRDERRFFAEAVRLARCHLPVARSSYARKARKAALPHEQEFADRNKGNYRRLPGHESRMMEKLDGERIVR